MSKSTSAGGERPAKGALKNLSKTIANDAYDLGGAYVFPKSANAIRFDQLYSAMKKLGTKVGKNELGKVLPLRRLVTTGSFDVVTDVTGSKAESCDTQSSNSRYSNVVGVLIENGVQPIVNVSKH